MKEYWAKKKLEYQAHFMRILALQKTRSLKSLSPVKSSKRLPCFNNTVSDIENSKGDTREQIHSARLWFNLANGVDI
ncbi:hypothetical protein N7490_011784 [Penicillium lividum]|nr:hypothetical protein N7490_011784 [Penicillium lividum]